MVAAEGRTWIQKVLVLKSIRLSGWREYANTTKKRPKLFIKF